MRGVALVILMVAAFVAVILFLKSNDLDGPVENSKPATQFEKMKNAEKAVEDFNKATEQRMKDLQNIE